MVVYIDLMGFYSDSMGFDSDSMGFIVIVIRWDINDLYPLVNIQKAIKHGQRNSCFPINSMVIFHNYVSLPEGNTCGIHML